MNDLINFLRQMLHNDLLISGKFGGNYYLRTRMHIKLSYTLKTGNASSKGSPSRYVKDTLVENSHFYFVPSVIVHAIS
jgi:hypothetical protein